MARKKFKNEIERRYYKERDRLRKALERMEKRGIFQRGKLSNKDLMPKIPKKITEGSIRRLEKLSTSKLYETAELVSRETGEILAIGKQIKRIEREYKQARRQGRSKYTPGIDIGRPGDQGPSTADLIIMNIKSDIRATNSPTIPFMLGILDIQEAALGKNGLADLIEQKASELHDIIDRATGEYRRKAVQALGMRFQRIFYGATSTASTPADVKAGFEKLYEQILQDDSIDWGDDEGED